MENRFKYPHTPHFPWSPSVQNDDTIIDPVYLAQWNHNVVITEKMDGENSTMLRDHYHARSMDSIMHPSRTRMKALHGRIKNDIPSNWRLCGENVTAVHSIEYTRLPSFFMLFSIWDEYNNCLSWDDTVAFAEILNLVTVPVLYSGPWATCPLKDIQTMDLARHEGFVVRPSASFAFSDFSKVVAKWVRPGHVQTDQHWMEKEMSLNGFHEDN